jgi:hypothetical protein
MRSPPAIIVALSIAALLGLVAAALSNERSLAFTLGVTRAKAIKIKPREVACQQPITVPANGSFDGVMLAVGTKRRPGPPLDVSVRSLDPGGARTSRSEVHVSGTVSGGYRGLDVPVERTAWMARVPPDRIVAVCLTNRSKRSAFIYGSEDAAARSSVGSIDGKPVDADFALTFERRQSRSLAELVPAMLDRAALFRAGWIGGWTYLVLAALVLLAVPALLVRALSTAARGQV